MGRTLAEKVWDAHRVRQADGEPDLLYIDLHLVHEVTSPQAFDGLRATDRPVRRPDLTIATEDHNVPTTPGPIVDPVSLAQVEALRRNCARCSLRSAERIQRPTAARNEQTTTTPISTSQTRWGSAEPT